MSTPVSFRSRRSAVIAGVALSVSMIAVALHAADFKQKLNPASKIYVSDVTGESQIVIGQKIEDLVKKSVYNVQGTVIETKEKSTNALVYSNGTGIFFDNSTRVEVRRFIQEPFTPNRTDMEVEPSISQTQAFVVRGTIGICTSKLVAGSNMTYRTSLATVNIRGRKLVIEANDEVTKISMLEGDSTVHAGSLDLNGRLLHDGEQAVIRPGAPGRPNLMEIDKIPSDVRAALDEKVSMACMAKRTVFFDTRDVNEQPGPLANSFAADETSSQEIVAIPVVPTNVTPDITISPSTLPDSR